LERISLLKQGPWGLRLEVKKRDFSFINKNAGEEEKNKK